MFKYLNGNGVNALFFVGNTTSKLNSQIFSIARKQNGVQLQHRKNEVKRTFEVPILVNDIQVGTEPCSVTITLSGSNRDAVNVALAKALQDSVQFIHRNYDDLRKTGVSPREYPWEQTTVLELGSPNIDITFVTT